MGQTGVKNNRRIFSISGGDPSIPSRVTTLENNEYKILYFEAISTATGTITIPTGATVLLDQFYSGGDAIVETLVNGQPSEQSPVTAGGVVVSVSSFDTSGNFTLSGTPSSYPVALVYILKIKAIDYQNLVTANIMAMDEVSPVTKEKIGEVVNGAASATPNDTDLIMSVDTSVAKKNTWTQIKAFLKTYFDTLYNHNGFTIVGGWAITTVADSTTYYANSIAVALNAGSTNVQDFFIPKNCTLKSAYINVISGAASSETVTYNIYIDGVATLIATDNSTATNFVVSNTAINLACTQGQRGKIQIITPAYATNPASHRGSFTLYFE